MAYHILMPEVSINGKLIDLSQEEYLKLKPENAGIGLFNGDLTGNEHNPDGSVKVEKAPVVKKDKK